MRKHMDERFGKVFNYSMNPSLPKSLNIELNSNCNQKCVFCSFHGPYACNEPKLAMMDLEDVKKILDEAKRLGIGEKEVGFYLSGEVFLHKNFVEIVKYAKQLGFKYTFITTNGALATPEKMKEVLDAGLDSIRFSINAADRDTYKEVHGRDDFDKVVENIRFMNKYIKENNLNVATSISCVITKKTLGIQAKIREIFGELVEDILFIPVMLDRLKKDEDFIQEYQIMDDSDSEINKDFICPMLFDTMYISANLEVMPCCEAYDDDCFFYDLKEDFDLEKAWNCNTYQKYRSIFLHGADDKGTICENCILRMKGAGRLVLE